MKNRTLVSLALSSLFVASAGIAAAQENPSMSPPKVLVIVREYLKPGKSGPLHAITEGAFIKAAKDAKLKTNYMAVDSLSGPNRSLFLYSYDSFDAAGKDWASMTLGSFGAVAATAFIADGELLEKSETHFYLYHPEMSLHIGSTDPTHARYWQFQSFRVKPGHEMEWNQLTKIYTEGLASFASANWAMYESQFAEDNGGVWVSITPMKTLADVDQSIADGGKFWAGLGAAKQKQVEDLAAACLESSQTNIFLVNPDESYPAPEWVTSAPEIWGQH